MNRPFITVLVIFFSSNLFCQNLTIKPKNDTLFIDGHINNELIVVKNDTSLHLIPGLYNIYSDSLDFAILIKTKTNNTLSFKNNLVFYDGSDDNEFRFLNDFFSLYKSLINEISIDETNPDSFEISMYNVKKKLNDFLNKINDSNFNYENIFPFVKNYIDLIYYNSLCDFILNKNKSKGDFNFKLIPYFLDKSFYYKSINEDFDFVLFKKYIYNMTLLLSSEDNHHYNEESIRLFFSSFYQFAKQNLNQKLINSCLIQFVLDYATLINRSFYNDILKLIINISDQEKLFLETQYDFKTKNIDISIENLSSSNKFDFYMENIYGENVQLDDFIGKVLYIDIWASWCGPCRKLFPFSTALKKKFKKKQLKKLNFLYVSIDTDYKKWKKSLDQLKIDGINFISPADKNNSIGNFFQVSSIPRYILIDKSGNVIMDNAKRPNDETLYNDLLKLIDE
jgi:thiol-disulfide isomerase/thioredoxin